MTAGTRERNGGKSDLCFSIDAWPRPGGGEYIRDKYATWEVAI